MLFESYDRRINKVNAALNTYGIKDIDEAEAIIANAAKGGAGKPRPVPGYWREVERDIESKRTD